MGKFDNIAILTDLDGTFFGKGSRVVERNIEKIEYFKANGGLFTLATGRTHHNLEAAIPGLHKLVNAVAILCNGTYLYDFSEGRAISETFMNDETAFAAVKFLKSKFGSVWARVSTYDGFLFEVGDSVSLGVMSRLGITDYTEAPYESWKRGNWYKVVVKDEPEVLTKVRGALDAEFPGVFELNNSSQTLFEFQDKGISKGSAVNGFREYYRDKGRELMICACGDHENDLVMLKNADRAFCPENAIDSVKSGCERVFCSNEDGVIADIVEYLDRELT